MKLVDVMALYFCYKSLPKLMHLAYEVVQNSLRPQLCKANCSPVPLCEFIIGPGPELVWGFLLFYSFSTQSETKGADFPVRESARRRG